MARVGVVGATGLVGSVVRELLLERVFPIDELRFFASERSAGSMELFGSQTITVENSGDADFSGLDVVLMSAGGDASRQLAPKIADAGAVVIDNSSAWRNDVDVPLVVSEVNPEALQKRPKNIVANPNCTTMVTLPALKPLHDEFGLVRIIASTYQSVSGSGVRGVNELQGQVDKVGSDLVPLLRDGKSVPGGEFYAKSIAYNVVSVAGSLIDDETDEEHKFRNESRKILALPNLSVNATCVRVPVVTGHCVSVAATFSNEVSIDRCREVLASAPGVELSEIPNPLEVTGRDVSLVGRLRRDLDDTRTLHLFVTGDNLRKGAALNAVQLAELIVAEV